MKLALLALLGAFVASISGTPVEIESRILGGEPVLDPAESSFVACLTDVTTGIPIGNGWLYSDSWIVTTANIVAEIPLINLRVTVGMISQKVPIVGQMDYSPLQIIRHPDFNKTTMMHNVALLKMPKMKLSTTVYFTDYEEVDVTNAIIKIIGWGATMVGGLPSPKLNSGILNVFTDSGTNNATLSPCTKHYSAKKYNNAHMMCFGSPPNSITSPCSSDEGAPLVQIQNGVPVIVGMFASTTSCKATASGGMPPFISTRVNYYFYWFRSHCGLATGGTFPTAPCNNCITGEPGSSKEDSKEKPPSSKEVVDPLF